MAVTKLSIYNKALILCGERSLASDSEDVPSRHELDTAYDNEEAIKYCLELCKPKFSLLTARLTSPTTPSNHNLGVEYDFPGDYVSFYAAYSDATLDDPIERYIIEQRTIACDNDTNIWLRYVSSSRPFDDWTPTFANVVAAYLAKEIAPRIAPQKMGDLNELFTSRVEAAVTLEGLKEEELRPQSSTATLSDTWRKVYNKAFFIIGLEQISSNDTDVKHRVDADYIVGMGLVEQVLEDLGWTFGITSTKIQYDPNLEPDWGYNRVFAKPIDMHRLNGIFQDDHFQNPLKNYVDEGDRWYCGLEEIYVEYVKTEYLTNADDWPQYFANVVAAEMAVLLAPSRAPKMLDHAVAERDKYQREGESTDAMRGPPQRIRTGAWVNSRFSGRRNSSYNQRP